MSYEQEKALYEAKRNEAMDEYFEARPQLTRTIHAEKIFEGGFRMAWDLFDTDQSIKLIGF